MFQRFQGALVTGAQLNEDGTARMDFDLPDADNDRLRALEPEINDVIRQDLPLRYAYVPEAEGGCRAGADSQPVGGAAPGLRRDGPGGGDRGAGPAGVRRDASLASTGASRPVRILKIDNKGRAQPANQDRAGGRAGVTPEPRGLVPFRIDVPASVLEDLAQRLARARWPGAPADAGWDYGIEPGYFRRLVEHRCTGATTGAESRPGSTACRSSSPRSGATACISCASGGLAPYRLPLVLTHGWPGSFVEFEAVVGPLAHPERFGGRLEDAFDVIVPSLPGYGWSSAPATPISTRDIARIWDELVTSTFGYGRYVAQGGDWGGLVTSWLGVGRALSRGRDPPEHHGAAALPGRGQRAAEP